MNRVFTVAEANLKWAFFMFWAGSLHLFGPMWDGRFMQVTLSRDRMSLKLTNYHNEVRYPGSHFPILWFISLVLDNVREFQIFSIYQNICQTWDMESDGLNRSAVVLGPLHPTTLPFRFSILYNLSFWFNFWTTIGLFSLIFFKTMEYLSR